MPKLIALVATAVVIKGERTVIQPGQVLPELSKHDQAALIEAGAIEDVAASLRADKEQSEADAKAMAEFEAARQAVQAEAASIQTDMADDSGSGDAAAPAAKPAGREAAGK